MSAAPDHHREPRLAGRDTRTAASHLRLVPPLHELADEDLMCRYRDGDAAAFEVLVLRHRGRIHRFLARMVRNPQRVEELLGDVFLKLHRAAPRYEPSAKFTTYLYTIAYRAALNAQDRARHRLDHAGGDSIELEQRAPGRTDGTFDDPHRALGVGRDLAALDRQLDALPDGHRACFLLYYGDGLSCAEIAEALEISADDAKGRLAYARKILRRRLTAAQRERAGTER